MSGHKMVKVKLAGVTSIGSEVEAAAFPPPVAPLVFDVPEPVANRLLYLEAELANERAARAEAEKRAERKEADYFAEMDAHTKLMWREMELAGSIAELAACLRDAPVNEMSGAFGARWLKRRDALLAGQGGDADRFASKNEENAPGFSSRASGCGGSGLVTPGPVDLGTSQKGPGTLADATTKPVEKMAVASTANEKYPLPTKPVHDCGCPDSTHQGCEWGDPADLRAQLAKTAAAERPDDEARAGEKVLTRQELIWTWWKDAWRENRKRDVADMLHTDGKLRGELALMRERAEAAEKRVVDLEAKLDDHRKSTEPGQVKQLKAERDQLRAQLTATADKAGSERQSWFEVRSGAMAKWGDFKALDEAQKYAATIRNCENVRVVRVTEVREVIDEAGDK